MDGGSSYPAFKCRFGEYASKTLPDIAKELMAKAYLYNMLINL
jgi:hypothetical protein